MKILDIQILGGPNYWSIKHKVIQVKLDIDRYEELPSDRLKGFTERLVELMPGIYDHHCSKGRPGGFVERLKSGTWMGHIVEHIAIELENMAGLECNFGKTRSTEEPGIYNVVFEYKVEQAGEYAAEAAVRIADTAATGGICHIEKEVRALKEIAMRYGLGPSTTAIVDAAIARGIPYYRLDEGSFVQLGYGSARKRIEATLTDHTGVIASDLASDKQKTKKLLGDAGVQVPEGDIINDLTELFGAIDRIGFPVAIKPNNGNQGKGVSLNINTHQEAETAYNKAVAYSRQIMVEKYCRGNDYRLLVVNYKLVAAALRSPACVTGDGISSIRELIDETNNDPRRGDDHENILTRIKTDNSTLEYLHSQDLSYDNVPEKGRKVLLRLTANLSTGGTSEDVTDIVHPEVRIMAMRAARTIGLDICGIDYISEDISKPVKRGKGYVLELNAAPGFRMHTHPFTGKPRPVGEAVVDMLFPGRSPGRIPIVAVTGTNGKTTTTRILAHIARTAGFNVGFTTTEGIYIGSQLIEEGDCTGPVSAAKVLKDGTVNFAVLECARGGILRSGLAFDHCDTGIVTNVAEDHMGLRGINTLEEMARVKSIVPESVHREGTAVLNANDDSTYAMKKRLKCRISLFSIDAENPRIKEHCSKGGIAAVYGSGKVILLNGNEIVMSRNVADIPISFDGKANFMIENILAATLAAWSRNIDPRLIDRALQTFVPSYENTPGRMNLFKFSHFSFLLDYAHNFHGITALGDFIKQSNASYRIGIISTAGDRRDIDLFNVGKASAGMFDKIIIRIDEDTRGRKDSEIIELIYSGIVHTSKNIPVEIIKDESEAVEYALQHAFPGSLIVLFADKITKVAAILDEFRHKEEIYQSILINK